MVLLYFFKECDHERGPFKLPFLPSSHFCFVNRGSRIEQLQDLFSTRRARVPTRPTDRLLLAKIRTAAAIFDNQLRRLRASAVAEWQAEQEKRERLHGSFEQADGSLTFGNCTKTLVMPRASELIPRCHSQSILRCIGIAFYNTYVVSRQKGIIFLWNRVVRRKGWERKPGEKSGTLSLPMWERKEGGLDCPATEDKMMETDSFHNVGAASVHGLRYGRNIFP